MTARVGGLYDWQHDAFGMSIKVEQQLSIPVSSTLRAQLGRVGVLLGGESAERDISLLSGRAVLTGLLNAGVDALEIDIGKDAIKQIQQANLDRAFIMLHGPGGEDGRMQALLSYMALPFTGSKQLASGFAMDKLRSKQLWRGIGLPTPEFLILTADSDWQQTLTQLGGAVMVKPAHEGSSIGMAKVNTEADLRDAYFAAAQYDSSVIAERVINGAEYTVAVLGGEALPVIQLETDNQFYDFNAKYVSEDTRYICPSHLSAGKEDEIKALALAAFASLACEGWGRVDFMADQHDNFYLLEVNTVPGMTSHSLVPMAAKAAGMSFEELVVRILVTSLKSS